MSIEYYPLTRIKTNLYTRGGDFVNPDGTPYVGRYYILYNGEVRAGINPVVGSNQPLLPAASQTQTQTGRSITTASPPSTSPAAPLTATTNFVLKTQATQNRQLKELTPYYPVPLSSDYARGYFTRYFAKNTSGPGYVVEISQTDWADIQDGNTEMTMIAYESTSLLWQLTGPLHDTRVSQYQIKGGVYDTNKRVTEAKAKGFVGLLSFIGEDYTKFARITP